MIYIYIIYINIKRESQIDNYLFYKYIKKILKL